MGKIETKSIVGVVITLMILLNFSQANLTDDSSCNLKCKLECVLNLVTYGACVRDCESRCSNLSSDPINNCITDCHLLNSITINNGMYSKIFSCFSMLYFTIFFVILIIDLV